MYSHITKRIPIKMYSIYSYFILRFYDLQQMFNRKETSKLFALSIVSKNQLPIIPNFLNKFCCYKVFKVFSLKSMITFASIIFTFKLRQFILHLI